MELLANFLFDAGGDKTAGVRSHRAGKRDCSKINSDAA